MKKFFIYLGGNILFILSYLMPKSEKIWVFGAWGGYAWADNPKFFFNYISSFHKEITPIWLTRDNSIVHKLRSEGRAAYHINSIKGLFFLMRARVAITSHGMSDLNRFVNGRLKIVETWHGIPMKPVLLSDCKANTIKKYKKLNRIKYFFPFLFKEVDFSKLFLICGSGWLTNSILKKVFGENVHFAPVGFPRLDGVFHPDTESGIAKTIEKEKAEGFRTMIYMPTYRQSFEFDIIGLFERDLDLIDQKLTENKIKLFVKLHPFDYQRFGAIEEKENVKIIYNEDIKGDIYSVLGIFDILVTDYSSVLFDFLYLGRPIFLLVPDKDMYIESNGDFVVDCSGFGLPEAKSWEDILQNIDKEYPFTPVFNLRDKIHVKIDDHNSERLYNYIMKRLKKC